MSALPRSRRSARVSATELASCREGAAILEFALVLPILFALIAGCFEIGRALLIYQAMSEAVHSGARTLARLPDPSCRPDCSPGVLRAVEAARAAIVARGWVSPQHVRVVPVAQAGTVAMRAEVSLAADLLPALGLKRALMLRAAHQEIRVGE